MNLTIRPETVDDCPALAEINALAFGRMEEAILVDMLRHDARFDPALSLVAERDGVPIGHALFVVYDVWLDGELMPAAELAPLAVHPDAQKQGIGGALLERAFDILRERGVQFAFHYGHDSYYPRFGYVTHMFGSCAIEIKRQDIVAPATELTARPVAADDIPALMTMHDAWLKGIDMVHEPLDGIVDWWSSHPAAKALVLTGGDGTPRGYVRYRPDRPNRPLGFLAADGDAFLAALALLDEACPDDAGALSLPLHPNSPATKMIPVAWEPRTKTFGAGMIKPLVENAHVQCYIDEVIAGDRLPGLVLMQPIFDLF